jgi:predicted transcriptional regulator
MISTITRKANLSHYITIEKCDSLIKAGLMESKRTPRNVIFAITKRTAL